MSTPDLQAAAEKLRLARQIEANRLQALRRAVQSGNPHAAKRLKLFRLTGFAYPNPDRRASCLRHLNRAKVELAELEACTSDPDLLLIAYVQGRIQLYQQLGDLARG
ncbi:hypothetical protein [Deinococcus aquaedulcis]|uniref:hypothetical protein n=1 Tax=Deinococcus aquaedulcis TaxID=2840455 RepID=UPI001C839DE2|nr:hypothetical protein [Deinococcus aquaedulcis]